jgi:hypothetical protein
MCTADRVNPDPLISARRYRRGYSCRASAGAAPNLSGFPAALRWSAGARAALVEPTVTVASGTDRAMLTMILDVLDRRGR